MKKKILSLCLVVALAATAVIGGTLAYFTDTEAAANNFVVGEMDIELEEVFDDETPLMPGNEAVTKEVKINNKGTADAYVRLLIAYEDTQDVGAMAHMVMNEPYATDGVVKDVTTEDRYVIPGGNGDWLQIKDEDGTVYTVAFVTISAPVAADGTTDNILEAIQISAGADNAWAEIVGDNYEVLVLAQGAQTIDGMNATESLEAAFGFKMDAAADTQVAKLFTDAGLGTFSAHTYTSVDAWTESTAWQAVQDHPTPYIQNGTEATVVVNNK